MMHSPLRFLPFALWKRRPVHFTFFVTRRCNARCPFCFYLGREGAGGGGEELTLEEVRRFAPSLGSLLWLAFSGGEVFLRGDLPEISRVLYDATRPSVMLYPTNAFMPALIRENTERILKDCPKSSIVVKLSLDGVGPAHDAMRGVAGGFEKVMETHEALRGLLKAYPNFELGINTVFCSQNQDMMEEIIGFVKGMVGVRTHTISLARGDIREGSYKEVDAAKYLEAARSLESGLVDGSQPTYGFAGARVKAAQDVLQRRIIHRTFSENKRQLSCYAGRLNLVMTECGDLYPCEDFSDSFRLGNVRESGYDIKKALKGGRADKVLARARGGCFCTHECYTMTNVLFNPRMYPPLLRELLRIRRR